MLRQPRACPTSSSGTSPPTTPGGGGKFVGDITYIHTWQGVVYLTTVNGCYSKKVVGWSIAEHMRTGLVADALRNAAAMTLIEPLAIWHSVRGSVYTSMEFRVLVTGQGMRSSMGRTGCCYNSMAESFFSALKNERVYRTVYATKSQARNDAIRYTRGFTTAGAVTPRSVTGGLTKSTMVINSQPWQRRRTH